MAFQSTRVVALVARSAALEGAGRDPIRARLSGYFRNLAQRSATARAVRNNVRRPRAVESLDRMRVTFLFRENNE